jgi:hypothetical protein
MPARPRYKGRPSRPRPTRNRALNSHGLALRLALRNRASPDARAAGEVPITRKCKRKAARFDGCELQVEQPAQIALNSVKIRE